MWCRAKFCGDHFDSTGEPTIWTWQTSSHKHAIGLMDMMTKVMWRSNIRPQQQVPRLKDYRQWRQQKCLEGTSLASLIRSICWCSAIKDCMPVAEILSKMEDCFWTILTVCKACIGPEVYQILWVGWPNCRRDRSFVYQSRGSLITVASLCADLKYQHVKCSGLMYGRLCRCQLSTTASMKLQCASL